MIPTTSLRNRASTLRRLLLATLLASAACASQAATYNFQGQADSGPLAGAAFSGQLSFADPAAGLDGSVDLSSFSMQFQGQHYKLADADSTPLAWFAAGSFIGVDFVDMDAADPTQRPWVALTAGFSALDEQLFAYDHIGSGTQGLGGVTQWTLAPVSTPVGAPTPLALAGVALAALAWSRRRTGRRGAR